MRRNIIGKKKIKIQNLNDNVWTNTFCSIIVSVILSIIVMLLLCTIFSALTFFVLKDMKFVSIFVSIILCIGIYTGTYISGKYRRSKGLIEGGSTGLILFVIILLSGIVFNDAIVDIKKLILLVLFGAIGGIKGVNSKRPKNLRK